VGIGNKYHGEIIINIFKTKRNNIGGMKGQDDEEEKNEDVEDDDALF
jgi:hypothetical protein